LTRNLFWIGLTVAAVAAAWLVLSLIPMPSSVHYEASNPWAIGNSEDAFDYAGEDTRRIEGTARLRFDLSTKHAEIEIQLMPLNTLALLREPQSASQIVLVRMHLGQSDDIWADRTANGDSGIGEPRLPETYTQYGGSGTIEIWVDGEQKLGDWQGIWSIGDALRQSDGSIRDQGLVFSPLLRDRSGFSDPERRELTLLIYDAPESDTVILHLVFPDVHNVEN